MKLRLLLLCLLAATVGLADRSVRPLGAYLTLGRDLVPGATLNDTWLFQPLNPDQGICIFLTNQHPSQSTSFNLAVYQSGDPLVPQYTGYEYRFRQDTVQGAISPVSPLTTATAFVHTSAAAKVALRISGSSGGGPVDLYVVQTSAGSCGPVNASSVSIQGSNPIDAPLQSNPIVIAATDLSNVVRRVEASQNPGSGFYGLSVRWPMFCSDFAEVPTLDTLITANTTSSLGHITLSNTTNSVITVTVTSNETPPKTVFTGPLSPKSLYSIAFNEYLKIIGVRWFASAAGVNGQVCLK